MKERLQKLIANAGLTSRRQAESWIEAGRVRVNGRPATLGESADPAVDRIEVDGRPLPRGGEVICLLLHKPSGYVTSARDPQGRPVVVDLVKEFRQRLYPVGRLDLTTSGLLLLTNDGELAQRLTHPRHEVEKTYLARIRGHLAADQARRLESGILLEDGPTAPAKVRVLRSQGSHGWIEISIREGRNRQVRRMFEAVGHPVSRLQRTRLAFLDLGELKPGQYRRLTADEIRRLKELT